MPRWAANNWPAMPAVTSDWPSWLAAMAMTSRKSWLRLAAKKPIARASSQVPAAAEAFRQGAAVGAHAGLQGGLQVPDDVLMASPGAGLITGMNQGGLQRLAFQQAVQHGRQDAGGQITAGWPWVRAVARAARRKARSAFISGMQATGATRMSPLASRLSLMGRSGEPPPPARSDWMQVFAGARCTCKAACLSSRVGWLALPLASPWLSSQSR
jgi:hypothetical protein